MKKQANRQEPDLPLGYFANEPTNFLVKTRNRKSDAEGYELQRELIRRVSENGEFGFLLTLIKSKNLTRKAFGSFLVGEVLDKTGLVWPALRKTLTSWSSELIHGFRYRFVDFVITTKYYDKEISRGMRQCLSDDSSFVRQSAIDWLCWVHPSDYVDFHKYCVSENTKDEKIGGQSKLNARLSRAQKIAALVRQGEIIDSIMNKVEFEEFETFEYLKEFESRLFKNASMWESASEEYESILKSS